MDIKTIPAEVTPTFKMDEMNMKKLFVTSVYKYIDFKNTRALEELKKIDFCKNNFSDATLINYLAHIRNYTKYGTKTGNCPAYVYDIVDDLVARRYAKLRPSEQDRLSSKGRPPKAVKEGAIRVEVKATKEEPAPTATAIQTPIQMNEQSSSRQSVIAYMQAEVDRLMQQKTEQEKKLAQINTQIETFSNSIKLLGTIGE